MAAKAKSKLGRAAQFIFKWLRIAVLFCVFLLVFVLAYLHQIGLPEFAKQGIAKKLLEKGWDIQFRSAKLDWGHKLILEEAGGRRADQPLSPSFSAQRLELDANPAQLLQSQIRSLSIVSGQLRVPVSTNNDNALSLEDLQLHVTFLPGEQARLHDTHALVQGIRIDLDGTVDHVTSLRDWKFQKPAAKTNINLQAKLQKVFDVFAQLKLSPPPRLEINFTADGRDTNSVNAHLKLSAPSAKSPWGDAERLILSLDATNLLHPSFGLKASAMEVATRFASGRKIFLEGTLRRNAVSNYDADLKLEAASIEAQWKETNSVLVNDLHWNGTAILGLTNPMPSMVKGKLDVGATTSQFGSIAGAGIELEATALPEKPIAPEDWFFWGKLAPYRIHLRTDIRQVDSPKLKLEKAAFTVDWAQPAVIITNLSATLYNGGVKADATLDVGTRMVRLKAVSDFDPKGVTQLMTPMAQTFFGQFDWQKPPKINAGLSVIMPPWTNRHPDWRATVAPTVKIAGNFTVGQAAFRKVPVDMAASEFGYTNRTWTLPHLHATNSSGEAYLYYQGSELTHDYHFIVDSAMDPHVLRPLFDTNQLRFFDEAQFTERPKVHGDIRGQWRARELTGVTADLNITNFTGHGVAVDGLTASIEYTNQVATVRDLNIFLEGKRATAPLVVADFVKKVVTLTNVFSQIDPRVPIRSVGPRGPQYLLAFQFTPPPTVKINGSFAMNNPLATDLHFDVEGDKMQWTNLSADHISGRVDWVARTAALTNIHATLYGGGHLDGNVYFTYQPKQGTDFRTEFMVTNVSLPLLARGLSGKTNKLEGLIDGKVTITKGHTTKKETWEGFGYADLNDGLLWEIPAFGIFSPILNGIKEGAGNSRAKEASGNFIITNAAVYSEDLMIHSSAVRLLYKGSVGFDKKLDARVEAEILRDTPIIGHLISLALLPLEKLFIFKVSGTTVKPVTKPLYVPTFMVKPFSTFKLLRPSDTNAPPVDAIFSPKQAK